MRVRMKLAVALRMPRTAVGDAPASPLTRVHMTGVPDITVDSARNATLCSRASSVSWTPCRATGHLLEVTTGPAPKSLPHVRDAGLAARRTRGHLDEHVGVCRSKTFDRAAPMANAGQLTERPPAGHVLEQDPWVEAIGVVDGVTRTRRRPRPSERTPYRPSSLAACSCRARSSHCPTVPSPTIHTRTSFIARRALRSCSLPSS